MDKKKTIYQIVLDCWNIAKKYLFIPLDDELWEAFIAENNRASNNYKDCDIHTQKLFTTIITALVVWKEADTKNGKN